MDPRDAVLQQITPTVMVPRFGEIEPLDKPGHRFLIGSNGLWLELQRAWLYARVQLKAATPVAMPYGVVTPALQWRCPAVPLTMVQDFARMAKESCPNEAAAWIVWNEISGAFALKPVGIRSVGPSMIHFDRPRLGEGEHLVVDLHSHGCSAAFFSGTDNKDDKGEVKVAVVLGYCNQETVDIVMRLCLLGKFIALEVASAANGVLTFREKQMKEASMRRCA